MIFIVFCGATGMIFGGWVIKKFNMNCKNILVLILVTTLLQIPQVGYGQDKSCEIDSL